MIIDFTIRNFGSIKDEQTLSFVADKSTHLEDHYVVTDGGMRLLKVALIYGKNASGKSTVLKALDFLREIATEPKAIKTDELGFNPFLFDVESRNQNSKLGINFVQNNIRYSYDVEFSRQAIMAEELYFYNPNKAKVFTRKTNLTNRFTEIEFGRKIKRDKVVEKALETNTLWNNTVLGGFLKTNIKISELQDVIDWFKNYLNPLVSSHTGLKHEIMERIEESEISKDHLLTILKQADFNISNFVIRSEETPIATGILEFLRDHAGNDDPLLDGKYTMREVELEHTVEGKQYSLPMDLESEGTQRYFEFAGLLSLLIGTSTAFPIDEIESSLHPDLLVHFLLSFIMNAQKSQVIATTHYREILDDKDIFRNDMIWITDKSETCATELYSLADFDSSIIRDTTNVLNAYKSGKLRGIPNLGDYYINIGK